MSSDEPRRAAASALNAAAEALFETVDDLDRAIEWLGDEDRDLRRGLEASRERLLGRCVRLGFDSLVPTGDRFDPFLHEAIALRPGVGRDGTVVATHRRGWVASANGELMRPAIVTVRQGTELGGVTAVAEALERTPEQPRRRTSRNHEPPGLTEAART